LRRAMLIVLLLGVLSACAGQTPQAGQSRSPFELWVVFRPQVGTAVAMKVLSDCRHQPDVIGVGKLVSFHGALRGTVYTKHFGRSGKTKALLGCLLSAGSVRVASWPS
jgi:hypothetical protein